MDTSEYYGGLYPDPPEEIEENNYDEDFYDEDRDYELMKMEELENGK
jgi:hypothetical protein